MRQRSKDRGIGQLIESAIDFGFKLAHRCNQTTELANQGLHHQLRRFDDRRVLCQGNARLRSKRAKNNAKDFCSSE
jgi:hypothetical protein